MLLGLSFKKGLTRLNADAKERMLDTFTIPPGDLSAAIQQQLHPDRLIASGSEYAEELSDIKT